MDDECVDLTKNLQSFHCKGKKERSNTENTATCIPTYVNHFEAKIANCLQALQSFLKKIMNPFKDSLKKFR